MQIKWLYLIVSEKFRIFASGNANRVDWQLLMHYYFHFIGIMTAGGAYTLKAATISALPFKIAKDTTEISSVVDKILSIKDQDHDANVLEEESEIDSLVYQLYGLTEEEIIIVEECE